MLTNAIIILLVLLTVANFVDYLKKKKQLELVETIITRLIQQNGEIIASELVEYLKGEILKKVSLNELKFLVALSFLNAYAEDIKDSVSNKVFYFMVGDLLESSKENSEQTGEEDIKVSARNSTKYKTNNK